MLIPHCRVLGLCIFVIREINLEARFEAYEYAYTYFCRLRFFVLLGWTWRIIVSVVLQTVICDFFFFLFFSLRFYRTVLLRERYIEMNSCNTRTVIWIIFVNSWLFRWIVFVFRHIEWKNWEFKFAYNWSTNLIWVLIRKSIGRNEYSFVPKLHH